MRDLDFRVYILGLCLIISAIFYIFYFFKMKKRLKPWGLFFAMFPYSIFLIGSVVMLVDMIYDFGATIFFSGMILFSLAGISGGYECKFRYRFLKEGEVTNEGDLTSLRYSTGAIISGCLFLGIAIISFFLVH